MLFNRKEIIITGLICSINENIVALLSHQVMHKMNVQAIDKAMYQTKYPLDAENRVLRWNLIQGIFNTLHYEISSYPFTEHTPL